MNLPSRKELAATMTGVRGLLRFDPRALAHFDNSHRGFWMSFWAAALLFPLAALQAVHNTAAYPPGSLWRYLAYQLVAYALSWVAFPFIMLWLADHLGRRERYFGYFAAYNWFQIVETVVFTLIALLGWSGVLPTEVLGLLDMMLGGAFLGFEWFIARHALAIEPGAAALLVAIDFLLGLVISWGATNLP